MLKPTAQIYSELQTAYDHFNKELFAGALPACILLLDNKDKRTYGYYSYKQFVNDKGIMCDAIALNPQFFAARQIVEVMQTVVHEMCHLWQYHFGDKKSERTYHNKEWGDKMESVGLMPSASGRPGGRKTGQQMADYAIEGGIFLTACSSLLSPEFKISWKDRFSISSEGITLTTVILGVPAEVEVPQVKPGGVNKSLRVKYTCPECQTNVWGKPDLNICCGDCNCGFVAQH